MLVYHRVTWKNMDQLDPFVKSTNPKEFEKQITFLKTNFNIINFDQPEKPSKKKRNAIITFDDGYIDNYLYAYPILKKHNCPATILLTTGYINTSKIPWWDRVALAINNSKKPFVEIPGFSKVDLKNKRKAIMKIQNFIRRKRKREEFVNWLEKTLDSKAYNTRVFLNWSEIKEMSKNNISFGAHTITHPILTIINKDAAKGEILGSIRKIENNLKKKVIVFAYPNGHIRDMNHELDSYLKYSGIKYSLTADYGSNKTDSFRIRRVGIEYDDDMNMFRFKTLGMGRLIANLYMRFRG